MDDLGSHLDSFADLKSYIRADLRSRGDPRSPTLLFLIDPVCRFTILMRVLEYVRLAPVRLPLKLWYRRLGVRLGFSIEPGIFGPGLAIVHYGLIVIDPTTRIGSNCRVHQGVHIGGSAKFVEPEELSNHSPRIGNNVYLGPGAKIYGPVVIGDDCTVGANAVVTHSFPEDGLVLAGVPAQVIKRGGINRRVMLRHSPPSSPRS
jgi:serine O-acetyltransferase